MTSSIELIGYCLIALFLLKWMQKEGILKKLLGVTSSTKPESKSRGLSTLGEVEYHERKLKMASYVEGFMKGHYTRKLLVDELKMKDEEILELVSQKLQKEKK